MEIKNIDFLKNNYNKNENNIKQGEILTGTVISQTEEDLEIKFENNILKLPKNKLNANLGEQISFEVLDNKNNKLSLKQIISPQNKEIKEVLRYNLAQDNNTKNVKTSKPLDDGKAYKNFINKNNDIAFKDSLLFSKDLKNNLKYTSNGTNKNGLDEMIKNGLDPEKNTIFTMTDFISTSLDVDLENKAEKDSQKTKQDTKSMKMDLNMNGIDEEELFNFEKILSEVGLPLTPKNIESLKGLQDKFQEIKDLSESSIKSLLKKEGAITLEDIYFAKHNGEFQTEKVNIENISNLETQIKDILSKESIPLVEKNIDLAKYFIENQVDISKENYEKYNKLKNFQTSFDINNILQKGAINISSNKSINSVEIFENINNKKLFNTYNDLVNILPKINLESIQNLINNNIKVNLKNINEEHNKQINYEKMPIGEQAILSKLNLAKIQMKLTSEVVYNLSQKGIDINLKPLQDVINTLENIEMDNYKTSLKAVNLSTSSENISKIQNIYTSLDTFYPKLVYSTFKEILNNEIDFSIKGISNSINSKNILETFEKFKTVPDIRYGDKISNLKGEFEKILLQNGFELTESNLKAAKILTLNNIEFNEENLINVKIIDGKIDYIHNKLHPVIASNMLKKGINPLEKNIDDLINYIDDFSKEFGQTSKEKIAEQILSLDKDNTIDDKERNAIISVYRMLNLIGKENGGSIGILLKTKKNITLGNLLEASKDLKNFKKNIQLDFKIDDKTEVKQSIGTDKSITKSIENAVLQNKNLEYNMFMLNQIINNSSTNKILEYSKNADEFSIEHMYEQVKDDENISVSEYKINDIFDKTKEIENISQDTLNYMIKNNIPITINNINNIKSINDKNLKISDDIEKFKNSLQDKNIIFGESILNTDDKKETIHQMLNTVDKLEIENEEVFDEIINLEHFVDIKNMILQRKNVASNIRFMKDINTTQNGIYTIPLTLSNGKITDFNMLILNSKSVDEKNINLFLQLENNEKQNIQAYVKVSENGSFANITTNTKEGLKTISNKENDILIILKKLGITPENIKYSVEDDKNIFNEVNKQEITNKLENLNTEFEFIV